MSPSPAVTAVILAHRGFHAAGHPENTLPAITAALDVADGVEFDVRETADGRLVLNHDPDLFGLPIIGTSLADLRAAAASRDHRLTELEEAISAIPSDRWLFMELKVAGIAQRALASARQRPSSRLRTGSFIPEHLIGVPQEIRWHVRRSIPVRLEPGAGLVAPAPAYLALLQSRPLPAAGELAAWQVASLPDAEALVDRGVRFLIVDDPPLFASLRS